MAFVLFFTVGLFIIPFIVDLEKHGRNNILVRSAHEALAIPRVAAFIRAVRARQESYSSGLIRLVKFVCITIAIAVTAYLAFLMYAFSQFDINTMMLGVAAVIAVVIVRVRFK